MKRLLIVDDVAPLAEQYAYDLKRLAGYEVEVAAGGSRGLEALREGVFDCVVLDLEMPGIDGFEFLKSIRSSGDSTPVVVYTGTGDFDRCVRAMRLGADGFIDKSEPMERVVHEIENVIERQRLRSEVGRLKQRYEADSGLVGSSAAMSRLKEQIEVVSEIPSPVLILGESGTGKEVVARMLHEARSPREPFIALNCAALPENLIESELFGHERGAFTGAHAARQGAFESAGAGTAFLDEIGEMPLPAQAKLLRVLETRELTRVGGNRQVKVNARVVAATNRDLDAEVREKRFREDLLYRLNVHVIRVPPLREHQSDIPALVKHFVATVSNSFGIRPPSVSSDAMNILSTYEYRRNNVRELRNVVERMIIARTGDTIGVDAVPEAIRSEAPDGALGGTLVEQREEAERRIIRNALDRNDGHVSNTASELGLADHSSLLKIMRRLGMRGG